MFQVLVKGHLLVVILRRGIGNFRTVLIKDAFKLARQLPRGWSSGEDDVLLAQAVYGRAKNGVHPQHLYTCWYGIEHSRHRLRLDRGVIRDELSRTETPPYGLNYVHRISDGHVDNHDI